MVQIRALLAASCRVLNVVLVSESAVAENWYRLFFSRLFLRKQCIGSFSRCSHRTFKVISSFLYVAEPFGLNNWWLSRKLL